MKNSFLHLTYILAAMLLISCSSSRETTTSSQQPFTQAQMANWEEQQRANQEAQRSGLDQEVVRKLKEYAEHKARLVCKMQKLDESSSQAISEVDQADFKQEIVTLDQELTALSKEIEAYCGDDYERTDFFNQLYIQYSRDCN